MSKRKKPRTYKAYDHQTKLLLAVLYLTHGNLTKAARLIDIPLSTVEWWANGPKNKMEWDKILEEARAVMKGFTSKAEADSSWSFLAKKIDEIAMLGAVINSAEMALLAEKTQKKVALSKEERVLAARLFEIGTEKAMAIRGIGKEGALGSAFDDFKDRIAGHIASMRVNGKRKRGRPKIDGDGESKTKLVEYVPKPPETPN